MKALVVLAIVGGAAHADPSLRGVLRVAPRGHCGGAYIPNYQPPPLAPAGGVTLLVRRGDKNSERKPAAVVTTANDGTFGAELKAGRYCVVFADKRAKPRKGSKWTDLKCLVADWQRCDAVVDVPVAGAIAIDHQTSCFGPCYHGPMPP